MKEKSSYNFVIRKDLSGEPIRLTLRLKEVYEGKKYNLYTICKVITVDKKDEFLPLYDETFTPKQYEKFFDDPSYYIPVKPEEVNT